jgi:dipeptidase
MCDTFVALPSAAADGSTILARHGDREPNQAQITSLPLSAPAVRMLRQRWTRNPSLPETAFGNQ